MQFLLRMQFNKLNKIMAIKVPQLQSIANSAQVERNYAFKDLNLAEFGVAPSIVVPYNTLSNTSPNQGADIIVDYDVKAILNSLYNLFNTSRGERYLFPRYGSNLQKHLFMPANDMTAQMLGADIKQLIKDFEPRISVVDVVVFIHDDNVLEAHVAFIIVSTQVQATMNILVDSNNTPVTISLNSKSGYVQ